MIDQPVVRNEFVVIIGSIELYFDNKSMDALLIKEKLYIIDGRYIRL
jgi:hypothetical protein